MKILLTLSLLIILSSNLSGQKIEPRLITSSGAYSTSGDLNVHWSLGELAVSTHKGGLVLTEGFFQNFEAITTSVFEKDLNVALKVFPNPVTVELHIQHDSQEKLHAVVYDILGQIVMQIDQINRYHLLNVFPLPSGQYQLKVQDKNGAYSIYKFIKL